MVAKDHHKNAASPKVEVGEIDTSPPFQSVKDAVNLFGEVALSGGNPAIGKSRAHCAERVLTEETHLHLAQNELHKLKEQLKNAETMKAQAIVELDRAKRTVDDLTQKLKTLNEVKESEINATEVAKNQLKQLEESSAGYQTGNNGCWKEDLEAARQQYMAVTTELSSAKQKLIKIRQDCDSCVEEKAAAIRQAKEADNTVGVNTVKVGDVSKEIEAVQESVGKVKRAILQAQEEEAELYTGKDVLKQSYKAFLEDLDKNMLSFKKEIDPELDNKLEAQLAETMSEVKSLQREMDRARTSDLDSLTSVTYELDDAKKSLHNFVEEENSLQNLVESLKLELEDVKKVHSELKEKKAEMESIAVNLHVQLRKSKAEFEAAIVEEYKARGASEEMISTLQQILGESKNAKLEVEEMKKQTEELKKETEATRIDLEDAEKKLRVALEEVEEAKGAELIALDRIKTISERIGAARASMSESGAQITISREEFESLSGKVKESEKLADIKVAAAMAQVEAVKASENEVLKKLEVIQKEMNDMKTATQEASKRTDMAEAARKAVEGELRRWYEREQRRVAENASRILAEAETSAESSPQNYHILKHNPPEKPVEVRKLDKAKTTSVSKKVLLPNLTIFHN